jgi:hypothetical protein
MFEKQPPEQTGEDPDRQEEAGSAGDPTSTIRGQAAAGDETVNVRMMQQVLTPTVQHCDKTDLGAKMTWIRGNGA